MNHSSTESEPFLTNSFGDRYLYSVNRNAFNALGSDALYQNHYGEKVFGEYQLNIILGTDSGLFLGYLRKRDIPSGSRYLFIELDDLMPALKAKGCLNDLPPEMAVVCIEDWLERAREFRIDEYIFIGGLGFHESLGAADGHRSEYLEAAWNVNLKLQSLIYDVRGSMGDSAFLYMQLENLCENRHNFSEHLMGAFAGKTAIVLAGGPSLKDALPWVKANRDKLVVIAVSRVCRQLVAHGVVPHIIVSVDPYRISFDVSKEMFHFAQESLFISLFHVTPHLLSQWSGGHIFGGPRLPWATPLNGDNLSYTGPTVGNTSLCMATYMGFSRIILAGVDLCYSREGQTHAEGSNESKVGAQLGNVSEKVETYGGWEAETTQPFMIGIPNLRYVAVRATQNGSTIYNCAPGAAKVPEIEYRSLDDFTFPEMEDPPGATLQALIPADSSKARIAHYRRVRKEIATAQRKFQEILALVEEALECCDGLFGRNGKKADFRHKLRMDKIERKLDKTYRKYTYLIKLFGIKDLLEIVKTPGREDEWTDGQIEDATRGYYENYRKSTLNLVAIVDNVQRRIASRLEEEAPHPDFAALFDQWLYDSHPGRVLVWKRRHPDWATRMTQKELEKAVLLEKMFERILAEKETTHLASLKKTHGIGAVLKKALLLFRRKNRQELELLAQGVETHQDQEVALPYLHLLRGLLAELQDQPDLALEQYQHLLVDPPHATTEDALKQIATLSIARADVDNAVLAVECLAGISAAYLPAYGDSLKAIGRYEESFDVYNRYLALVPDDISTLLKLGMFCQEAGLADLARDLFLKVLAEDENNSAAQTLLAELTMTPAYLPTP
jgi:tetratricopeptide (TPR) repeat protein